MATIDFTLEDVRGVVREEIFQEREYTRHMIESSVENATSYLSGEITKVRRMLEEDIHAESERLTRTEKRLRKASRLLSQHVKHATNSADR
ncbi:MAG: hypothetical protein JWN01_316 [Patescibacteria group bacterium]|jgi:hypothetical protein|nr:hypothetical protein [Patescibacteria group bacterium]